MSEKPMSEPKHTAISGSEVLRQFEDAISGKLDEEWNEEYTAPASFSIREMREIVRACNSLPELVDAATAAKEFLINDLEEPGRTVFWRLVSALAKAQPEGGKARPDGGVIDFGPEPFGLSSKWD
jgi:hypothetical protein